MQFDSFIDYETLEDWVERFVSNHGKIARAEVIARAGDSSGALYQPGFA